jgi:hypothetical protein
MLAAAQRATRDKEQQRRTEREVGRRKERQDLKIESAGGEISKQIEEEEKKRVIAFRGWYQ